MPIAILAFLSALFIIVASSIAPALFVIFRNVDSEAEASVNIVPTIGVKMFVFMWIASGCALIGWLVMMAECCCCASRRDVQRGRKKGRESAWTTSGEVAPIEIREREKGLGRGIYGRKKSQ